jgi:phospholipid/cholesterol/gamma-HCH transport system permease protein
VGRAATAAFVHSFVSIIVMDLFLGIGLDQIDYWLWPDAQPLF